MRGKPDINCEQHHATLSVADVRAAADFYADKLGFTIAFIQGTPPSFAGINLGSVQIFLQKGTPAPQGCSVYFVISDADALYEFHRANGVEIVEVPRDQPYELRDYTVRDMDGYYLNFGHRLRRPACATEKKA
jgi:catechol 2,3-dioxygenase-like lactoylglutathione lyase family enzyme